jgi:hypothetical protein
MCVLDNEDVKAKKRELIQPHSSHISLNNRVYAPENGNAQKN